MMPDHVHLIFTPLYDGENLYSVAEIMQGIKGASAHKINRLLSRRGQVWQRESLDRVLRREESIRAKVEYMIQNPVRAGLVKTAAEYRWLWVPDLAKSA
jgi:putative transposase